MENIEAREAALIERHLFIKQEDYLKRLDVLLERTGKYIGIEANTGTVVIKETDAPIRTQIALLLMGHYFYLKTKNQSDAPLSLSEIAHVLRRPITSLSGPVAELLRSGYIEKVTSGRYQMAYYRIEDFLDEIEAKKA